MKDEADRLLDRFEGKIAALSGSSVSTGSAEADDLPF
jgi:hypothetical protein